MTYRTRLFTSIALVIGLVACQKTPKVGPADASTKQSEDSAAVRLSWQQSDWSDGGGCLLAKGGKGYSFSGGVKVQADGSLTLSQLNAAATTINNDLNGDGYKDIIVANSGNYEFVDTPFAQIRHQNEDHETPDAEIYWGGPDGYDVNRHTGIPGNRPSSLAAMDLNLDGILDLAVAGGGEFEPPYVDSFIYWGSRNGYSEQNRIALPTYAATGTAAGDLNKDGYPDVIFANLGDYNFPFPPSLIYWGGPTGFSKENRTELKTHGSGGLAVTDINADDWLDIVITNSAGFPPVDELMDYGQDYAFPDSCVYLGGPNGFSEDRRITLPTNGASAIAIADLNKDSWLDIVFSVTGTYLYLGKPKFPNSYVYWGGPNGFSDSRRLGLPTEASQGATVTDVNGDGVLDILFSQLGDFNRPYRPVLIYYGTNNPDEFYTPKMTATLPGQVSYGSIVVGPPDGGDHMSHGDLAIPKYAQPNAYVNEGQLISSVAYFDQEKPMWTELLYSAEVPENAKAVLVFETSNDGESWAQQGHMQFESGQHKVKLADVGIKLAPYSRYRLVLNSANGSAAPTIKNINFS